MASGSRKRVPIDKDEEPEEGEIRDDGSLEDVSSEEDASAVEDVFAYGGFPDMRKSCVVESVGSSRIVGYRPNRRAEIFSKVLKSCESRTGTRSCACGSKPESSILQQKSVYEIGERHEAGKKMKDERKLHKKFYGRETDYFEGDDIEICSASKKVDKAKYGFKEKSKRRKKTSVTKKSKSYCPLSEVNQRKTVVDPNSLRKRLRQMILIQEDCNDKNNTAVKPEKATSPSLDIEIIDIPEKVPLLIDLVDSDEEAIPDKTDNISSNSASESELKEENVGVNSSISFIESNGAVKDDENNSLVGKTKLNSNLLLPAALDPCTAPNREDVEEDILQLRLEALRSAIVRKYKGRTRQSPSLTSRPSSVYKPSVNPLQSSSVNISAFDEPSSNHNSLDSTPSSVDRLCLSETDEMTIIDMDLEDSNEEEDTVGKDGELRSKNLLLKGTEKTDSMKNHGNVINQAMEGLVVNTSTQQLSQPLLTTSVQSELSSSTEDNFPASESLHICSVSSFTNVPLPDLSGNGEYFETVEISLQNNESSANDKDIKRTALTVFTKQKNINDFSNEQSHDDVSVKSESQNSYIDLDWSSMIVLDEVDECSDDDLPKISNYFGTDGNYEEESQCNFSDDQKVGHISWADHSLSCGDNVSTCEEASSDGLQKARQETCTICEPIESNAVTEVKGGPINLECNDNENSASNGERYILTEKIVSEAPKTSHKIEEGQTATAALVAAAASASTAASADDDGDDDSEIRALREVLLSMVRKRKREASVKQKSAVSHPPSSLSQQLLPSLSLSPPLLPPPPLLPHQSSLLDPPPLVPPPLPPASPPRPPPPPSSAPPPSPPTSVPPSPSPSMPLSPLPLDSPSHLPSLNTQSSQPPPFLAFTQKMPSFSPLPPVLPSFPPLLAEPPAFQPLSLKPPSFRPLSSLRPLFRPVSLKPQSFQQLPLKSPMFQSLSVNPSLLSPKLEEEEKEQQRLLTTLPCLPSQSSLPSPSLRYPAPRVPSVPSASFRFPPRCTRPRATTTYVLTSASTGYSSTITTVPVATTLAKVPLIATIPTIGGATVSYPATNTTIAVVSPIISTTSTLSSLHSEHSSWSLKPTECIIGRKKLSTSVRSSISKLPGSNGRSIKKPVSKTKLLTKVNVPKLVIHLGEDSDSGDDQRSITNCSGSVYSNKDRTGSKRVSPDFERKLDRLLKEARTQQETVIEDGNIKEVSQHPELPMRTEGCIVGAVNTNKGNYSHRENYLRKTNLTHKYACKIFQGDSKSSQKRIPVVLHNRESTNIVAANAVPRNKSGNVTKPSSALSVDIRVLPSSMQEEYLRLKEKLVLKEKEVIAKKQKEKEKVRCEAAAKKRTDTLVTPTSGNPMSSSNTKIAASQVADRGNEFVHLSRGSFSSSVSCSRSSASSSPKFSSDSSASPFPVFSSDSSSFSSNSSAPSPVPPLLPPVLSAKKRKRSSPETNLLELKDSSKLENTNSCSIATKESVNPCPITSEKSLNDSSDGQISCNASWPSAGLSKRANTTSQLTKAAKANSAPCSKISPDCTQEKEMQELLSSEKKLIDSRWSILEEIICVRSSLKEMDYLKLIRKQIMLEISHLRKRMKKAEKSLAEKNSLLSAIGDRILQSKARIEKGQSDTIDIYWQCEQLGKNLRGSGYNIPKEYEDLVNKSLKEVASLMTIDENSDEVCSLPSETEAEEEMPEEVVSEVYELPASSSQSPSATYCSPLQSIRTESGNDSQSILCPFIIAGTCLDFECPFRH